MKKKQKPANESGGKNLFVELEVVAVWVQKPSSQYKGIMDWLEDTMTIWTK